jgi:hypothetical protein
MSQHFVGRERELETLVDLLAGVRHGVGRAALIGGEAGIGKSTLVRAFADQLEPSTRIVFGHTSSTAAPPFWLWRQLLAGLDPAIEAPWTTTHAGRRETVFAEVVEILQELTADAPAVLVIEDLQWADYSSLALLRFVVDALPRLALVLAMTVREPLEPGPAQETIAGLPPAVTRLQLTGLPAEPMAAIVRQHLGPAVDDDALAAIHQRTAGNPFFVIEVARLWSLQGSRKSNVIPPGIRQVLDRRLARLSQATVDLLSLAACYGEIDASALTDLSGRSEPEVEAGLDEAIRSRLVHDGPDGLVFAHALVREVLEDDLGGRRAGTHRRIALWLEGGHGSRPEVAAWLAFHWARAQGSDAREKAAVHALAAARYAVRQLAYEQALPLYALALDGHTGDEEEVRFEVGETRIFAGDLPGGREVLRWVARSALDSGRSELAGRAVLAMGGGVGGFEVDIGDREQVSLIQRVLAQVTDPDSPLRAALLARLSIAITWSAPIDERIELATEAVAASTRVSDPAVRVSALAAFCDALAGPDHIDERLEAAAEMLSLAESTRDPRLVLLARRLRIVGLLERGDLTGVDREIAAYERTVNGLNAPLYEWPVPIWRGMRALLDGEVALAFDWADRAEEIQRRAQSDNAQTMVFTLRYAATVADGRASDTLPLLDAALPGVSGYAGAECFFAGAFAQAGRPDRARPLMDRRVAAGIDTLDKDSEFVEFVWQLGTAAVLLQDQSATRAAYDALEPYVTVWAVDGIGAAVFGVVAHQLGVLARHLGDLDGARRWLDQALDIHRAAGATGLMAATEAELSALGSAPTVRAEPAEAEIGRFLTEGGLWRLSWLGTNAIVPDSKGMRDIAILLGRPNVQVDTLALIGRSDVVSQGDAGPIIDDTAKRAYRQRLADLDEEIAEAEAGADIGRLSAMREERDLLIEQLSTAFGLGGRSRRLGDNRERARKAVSMRIRTALNAIEAVHPALARHLRNSISTGRFCSYEPERPTSWVT